MAIEKSSVHPLMAQHLQELMGDTELYGWEFVRAFHTIWLKQLEQQRVTWADEDAAHGNLKGSLSSPQQSQMKQVYNVPANLGSKACVQYNDSTCIDATLHPKELHICS